MDELKKLLEQEGTLGVVRSTKGDIRTFTHRGVFDLFNLLTNEPAFLAGAIMADKVIGRGAALLIIKGNVAELYARLISEPALEILSNHSIKVTYDKKVPHIINRSGNDICPVEKLTANTSDPDEAYCLIGHFLQNLNNTKR